MKISTGISEITLQSQSLRGEKAQKGKIYLWPAYNQGKVLKVDKISHYNNHKIAYTKASDREREEIIEQVKQFRDNEYSVNGKIERKVLPVKPGILFDAVV